MISRNPWNKARWIVTLIAAACCIIFYGAALAQSDAGAGTPPAAAASTTGGGASGGASGGIMAPHAVAGVDMGKGVPTVVELFKSSMYINSAILVLSVIALLLFLYLMLTLTSGSFNPPRFVDDVTKLILNRQFDQATHLCQSNSGIFASSIIQRVIENRDKEHGELMEILSAEGSRRGETVWNRVMYLSEISNIAPMLGLLGTVVGMMKVFFTLQTRLVGQQAAQLSAGIAEAMGTTMFGLIVAIAAGVFFTICRSRATRVLAEAEQVCHTIVDHAHRSASDPRLKKIDALAEAARHKLSSRSVSPNTGRGPGLPGAGADA